MSKKPHSDVIDDSIAVIEAFVIDTGVAESRLGQLGAANPYAIDRIRAKTATLRTLEMILAYIDLHNKTER